MHTFASFMLMIVMAVQQPLTVAPTPVPAPPKPMPATTEPAVKVVPDPTTPIVGQMVQVTVQTDAKSYLWKVTGPVRDVKKFGDVILFVPTDIGKIQIRVTATLNDTQTEAEVCLLARQPTPPIPPPAPPGPPIPPPAPAPVDSLPAALATAYASDPAPATQKSVDLSQLTALYVIAQSEPKNTRNNTLGDVRNRVHDAGANLTSDRLASVRQVISTELQKQFPADGPLDDPTRTKLSASYARIAASLSTVK